MNGNLQKIFKIIYRSTLGICCLIAFASILLWCLPIEFINRYVEGVFDIVRISVVLFFLLLLFIKWVKKDSWLKIIGKFVSVGLASLLIFFIAGIASFADMCDYFYEGVLFANKANPKVMIIKKSFGCGATDSGPATMHYYKSTEFLHTFRWISPIDTTKLNKAEWNRVDQNRE
jgi:predicted neutral ceramidase superfamily lipid hydrolase